jgi:hypothetical protein
MDGGIVHQRLEQLDTLFGTMNVLELVNGTLDTLNFRGRPILKIVENLEDPVGVTLCCGLGCHISLGSSSCTGDCSLCS